MTLLDLLGLLRKHWSFIAVVALAFTVVTGISMLFSPNQYTATTSMYVLSQDGSKNAANSTSSVLSAGQMLTNDVATLIKSDRIKEDVAQRQGMDSLNGYDIKVTSSTTTRVISLAVSGKDPNAAAGIANALVSDVSDVARQVMGIESVNVIDPATAPTSPSGPRRGLYTLVGMLVGLFVGIVIVVVRDLVDTRIKSSDEAESLSGVPVVGHFSEVGRV